MVQEIEIPTMHEIKVSTIEKTEISVIQETQVPTTEEIQVPATEEIQVPATEEIQVPTIKKNQSSSQVLKISKLKSRTKTHLYPSIMASFKPPYYSDSPMIASYGKRRRHRKPLSTINNNIIIKLPSNASSQNYSLNINLKLTQ